MNRLVSLIIAVSFFVVATLLGVMEIIVLCVGLLYTLSLYVASPRLHKTNMIVALLFILSAMLGKGLLGANGFETCILSILFAHLILCLMSLWKCSDGVGKSKLSNTTQSVREDWSNAVSTSNIIVLLVNILIQLLYAMGLGETSAFMDSNLPLKNVALAVFNTFLASVWFVITEPKEESSDV